MAAQDVCLGDGCLGFIFFTCTRCQACDLLTESGTFVGDSGVGDGQVSVVGHGDLVGDFFAKLVAAFRCFADASLHYGQVTVLVFRIIICVSRFYRYVRFVRIRAGSLGGCVVDDMAAQDVCLGDGCGGCEFFTCTRCQACDLLGKSGTSVGDCNICDGQVTIVGHGDLVAYGITKCVAICRLITGSFLHYGQVTVLFYGGYRCISCLRDLAKFRRYGVGEAACQDVCFCDVVSGGGFNLSAACYIFKSRLCKCYSFDLTQGDGLCILVDVGCSDFEGNFLAQCEVACGCFLGNYQVVFHFFFVIRVGAVGDGKATVDIGHFISGRDIVSSCILDLRRARNVKACSDQGLGSGYRYGNDLIAFCKFTGCHFVTIVGKCCTVVYLLVAGSGDGDRDQLCCNSYICSFGKNCTVGSCTRSFNLIKDALCGYIVNRYGVCRSQSLLRTRNQCEGGCRFYTAGKFISYSYSGNCQVSGVLHYDGVGHSVAQLIGSLICSLSDCDLRCLVAGAYRCRCRLFDVSYFGGYGVGKAFCEYISFCDGIGCGCFNRSSRFYILKCGLCKCYAVNLAEGDGACLSIDVGRIDGECDFITQIVRSGLCSLGNYQVVLNLFRIVRLGSVCDFQSSRHISDIVTRCHIFACRIHDLRFACYVLAFANQCLTSDYLHGIDLVTA